MADQPQQPSDVDRLAEPLHFIAERINRIFMMLGLHFEKATSAPPRPQEPGNAAGTPSPAVSVGVTSAGDVFGAITGVLGPFQTALAGATGALTALPNIVAPFVNAFNPGAVEVFGQALRDVQASIGAVLLPILTVFTQVLREVNSILAPAFDALEPVIASLAGMLAQVLVPIVKVLAVALEGFAALLQALMPVLQIIADLMEAMANVFRVFVAVLNAVWSALTSALGSGFRSAVDGIRSAIHEATRAFILFTARLLKFVGADTALENLYRAFRPTQRGGKTAAPQELGIAGIEEVMRASVLAAAQAGLGGAGPRTAEDHLAGISEQILDIARNGTSITAAIDRLIDRVNALIDTVSQTGSRVSDRVAGGLIPSHLQPLIGTVLARGRRGG
jgi:hypothetical protein